MRGYIFFCLIITMLSCSGSKEIPVEIYDLSFICPADWKLTDKEDYGDSKYLSIEKKGLNESGLLMVTYSDEEYDLVEYMDMFRELYKEQELLSGTVFQEEKNGNYGGYDGIVCEYTVSILSTPHEGRLYTFHANGKTVCVTEQEATEDKEKNKSGFEKINNTFSVK